jgi:maltose alpha-D-glucosyltransferase/alpha-amylase
MSTASHPSWLEKAVFYEIYPQTFYDSNWDGIGDIPGLIQKLDYIQSLGVNAIWLNPCFDSPFGDAGYDIRDYYKVAERYGTNQDLCAFFEEARKRGLRVLLDLVVGHTSFENEWFKQSCKHARNEYSDWFIWTDSVWAPPPPGMQAVRAFAERDGGYITNFFYMQPALNFGFCNPDPHYPWQQPVSAPGPQAVRREVKKIMKFWLDQGASGFRVDMAGSLVKNDPTGKETGEVWKEITDWLDEEYPEAVMVSEWSNPTVALPAGFDMDFTLTFNLRGFASLWRKPWSGRDPYGFSFFDPAGHGNIRAFVDEYLPMYGDTREIGFISMPTGNHDTFPRLSEGRNARDMELIYLFLMSMPGVPYIYYGDEIGMRALHGLVSVEGGYQRTGSRTPMQWDQSANAGFSQAPAGRLYLPVDGQPGRPTVAEQEANPASLLNQVRRLVELRKQHPALCASGAFEVVYAEAGKYPFIYKRTSLEETILVAINPSSQPTQTVLPDHTVNSKADILYSPANSLECVEGKWIMHLPGVSGAVYRV